MPAPSVWPRAPCLYRRFPGDPEGGRAQPSGGKPDPVQAALGGRNRGLSRFRRMARQGGRLCDPGAGRRFCHQSDRLLSCRRRVAALRDRVAAFRRGLSDPSPLAQPGVRRDDGRQ